MTDNIAAIPAMRTRLSPGRECFEPAASQCSPAMAHGELARWHVRTTKWHFRAKIQLGYVDLEGLGCSKYPKQHVHPESIVRLTC